MVRGKVGPSTHRSSSSWWSQTVSPYVHQIGQNGQGNCRDSCSSGCQSEVVMAVAFFRCLQTRQSHHPTLGRQVSVVTSTVMIAMCSKLIFELCMRATTRHIYTYNYNWAIVLSPYVTAKQNNYHTTPVSQCSQQCYICMSAHWICILFTLQDR